MQIMILGVRGFPHVEGGVETHAENLYPLLIKKGCNIELIARHAYMPEKIVGSYWRGIKISRLYAPKNRAQGLEAFIHSFLGVCYAVSKKPDILHIHSIGPGIFTPFARLMGLRVVITYHGQEYDREKWGFFGRLILRLGEIVAISFCSECIVISKLLQQRVHKRFKRDCIHIPNGVEIRKPVSAGKIMRRYKLVPHRYVLMVSRIDPVKRQLELINAFGKSNLKDWKLVIVGSADTSKKYVRLVIAETNKNPNVVMTGFQTGDDLRELYSNAGIFVLPSSQEGFSMVLLEALSYGLPVIASDIPGNLLLNLPNNHYFPLGNVSALASKLQEFGSIERNESSRDRIISFLREKHSWEPIAENTFEVYSNLLNPDDKLGSWGRTKPLC